MELVKGHLVLEEGPAEFGLVVDVGDFFDGLDGWMEGQRTRGKGKGERGKGVGYPNTRDEKGKRRGTRDRTGSNGKEGGKDESVDHAIENDPYHYAPACASNFFGTGSVDFLSSSSREGEMVKKSTPANALISPIYQEPTR